ncbi:hypothetical protein JCM10207_006177 [Rhodosporidiobolus poonsookiae]
MDRPPLTAKIPSSFTQSRGSDRTPSPLSPTAANTGYAPFSAPLPRTTGEGAPRNAIGMGGDAVQPGSRAGLTGLGVTDVSNTVWAGHAAGPASASAAKCGAGSAQDGVEASSSSAGRRTHVGAALPTISINGTNGAGPSSQRENLRPSSPPLIRTTSLPHLATVLGSSSTSSTSASSVHPFRSPPKVRPAHSHLRLDNSPTSPSRRLPVPSPLLHRLLRFALPTSLLPTSIAYPPAAFEYPKSPSLTRDPPTVRHARRPRFLPRRHGVVALVVVLCIILLAVRGPDAAFDDVGRWVSEREEAAQRRWREHGAQKARESPRVTEAEKAMTMERVDYAQMLEALRGGDSHPPAKEEKVAVEQPPAAPPAPPAVAEPTDAPVDDDHDHSDADEQAAMASIVAEAKEEHKVVEQEVEEKLAMAKKVKPADPDPDAGAAAQALVAKKKDPSRYKRLLPLGVPSRRYLYGANFILSAAEKDEHTEVDDPELSNHKVKVPSKKKLQRLFEQGQKRYREDEDDWRAFQWRAPEPHESLKRMVAALTPDELALRDWIKQLHHQPPAGGLGLGSSSSSPSFPPAPALDLAPIPSFDAGNLDKYASLIVQAESGHAGKCEGATWLDSYAKMHREMLSGEREPRFISYHCEQGINCGGLGDRLLGMTSAFFFGLVTNRAFLAEWQSPIPLDVVFDSPHVNWTYSSYTSAAHPILGDKHLVDAAAELDIIHFDRLSVDMTFGTRSWQGKGKKLMPGFERRDLAYQSPWIKMFTNRGMIYRSFKYKHLQKSIDRLGLQPTNAFACISQYLFRPKPPALDLIAEYTSVLALPSVFSVGIHIRTGDRSMKDLEWDRSQNTVKRHTQFFRCARELASTYASPSQRIVFALVTDSAALKADAIKSFGDRVVVTDMQPQHVHQKSGHANGVFSAVVEDWILAKTDMLVATQDSGFGKLAAFMHARENSTVTIFPRYNPDVMGLQSKKSHLKVDCTRPDVFTTFEELSSEWSLG